MKKRRTLIISLLLVAALMLGIGYAALSRELIISSTAILNPNNDDFKIEFTSADSSDDAKATASIAASKTTANYEVKGLSKQNDNVTLTYVVTNNTADVNAELTGLSLTEGLLFIGDGTSTPGVVSDYFTKTVTVTHDESGKVWAEDDHITLAPGKTATVTIVVTLKQTVTQRITLEAASVHLNFVDAP
ncbi:MAG: hypothetical protein IJD64_05085 [Clostridia bacterium]|nr:hypothetical protein [Clostridia bacterium]